MRKKQQALKENGHVLEEFIRICIVMCVETYCDGHILNVKTIKFYLFTWYLQPFLTTALSGSRY